VVKLMSKRLTPSGERNCVDLESLAGTVAATLVPYLGNLQRLGGKVGEQVLTESALAALGRLYRRVKQRLAPDSYATNQLAGLEQNPDREGRQQAFASALAEILEEDDEFAAELRRLVDEVRGAGIQTRLDHVEGPVAIGGDVHQEGHNVAGHDLIIRPEERRGPGG